MEEQEPEKKQRKAPAKPRATASKSAKAKKSKVATSDNEDVKEEETKDAAKADSPSSDEEQQAVNNGADASESEMSVLLDEDPKPKKKRAQKGTSGSNPKKSTDKISAKAKSDADADPDQAQIQRLQGWLVKCGIRKLWGKELKPYESPKAKIKHLKDMLADVGMTGRYSLEKANQIKESRELAADIEAVQEGAERWGAAEGEDGGSDEKAIEVGARPGARRLVRGAKNYDFLSSDGEETD